MINIGATKIGSINYQGNISKVLKGTELIWEKNGIKEFSWLHPSQISPFSSHVIVYGDEQTTLNNKYLIDIKINGYRSIVINEFVTISYGALVINLGGSLDELLGINNIIPANTKITVRYSNSKI